MAAQWILARLRHQQLQPQAAQMMAVQGARQLAAELEIQREAERSHPHGRHKTCQTLPRHREEVHNTPCNTAEQAPPGLHLQRR